MPCNCGGTERVVIPVIRNPTKFEDEKNESKSRYEYITVVRKKKKTQLPGFIRQDRPNSKKR